MRKIIVAISSLLPVFAQTALAQSITVEEVIAGIQEASRLQFSGVSNYWLQRDNFGISSFEYYEKQQATNPATGQVVEYMRMAPPSELYDSGVDSPFSQASPEDLNVAADMLRSQGPMMESGLREEIAKMGGLPGGLEYYLMNPPADQPWLSANPKDMMNMYGMMLDAGAQGIREQEARDEQERQEALNDRRAELSEHLEITGEGTLNGRPAVILSGDIPPQVQNANGQQFTMDSLTLWVDTEKFVTLKMRMEGEARQGNETRNLAIELEEMNHQPLTGCPLLELPLARVMRLSGVLSPEEEAEMSTQLRQLQQQLDSMPAEQRNMVMQQMGPQMAMLESMMAGGGIEMVSSIKQASCNTGLPAPERIVSMFTEGTGGSSAVTSFTAAAPGTSPASTGQAEATGDNLVQDIQMSLEALGYTPGNTDGEFDTATAIAITQFEAASSLPVTGEATPELAELLQALQGNTSANAQVATETVDVDAQRACLEEKIAAAQESQQRRRGFGSLVSAVGRVAGRLGNIDLSVLLNDINDANATAEDLASAARDLGLTEDDIAECQGRG